jgi:xanthine dehydrogenase accessory factor
MVKDIIDAVDQLRRSERLGAVLTVVEGTQPGAQAVVDRSDGVMTGGGDWVSDEVLTDANELMDREDSRTLTYGDHRILIEVVPPTPVILIFGAGHVAQPLSAMARILGFKVVVADARATFATPERFPDVDELIVGWPIAVFDHFEPDGHTYVVLLSHDTRFETPVFEAIQGAGVRYVGAMGSRRTHAARVERLRTNGWSDEEIDLIHGPIGLDIKAKTPAETAVSILAEIVQVRYQAGSGVSLRGTDAPIHITDDP